MVQRHTVMCLGGVALAGTWLFVAAAAGAGGPSCGAPCSGSCFGAHDLPACDDQVCCEVVCGQLPFCCVIAWNESCAVAASDLCGGDVPCDCNENGIPDDEDIANGTSPDVNGNGVPDECEPGPDCNANGIPDTCDIDPGDPDGDGMVSPDTNGNGVPDECEDCNSNGVLDDLDIDPADPDGDGQVSFDCDDDGAPDECAVLCSVDVVFVLDTSGSMAGELPAACDDMIFAALNTLEGAVQGQVSGTVLGIAEEAIACATNTVIAQLGNRVPGVPGLCCTPMCTDGESCRENWAGATAVVAEGFAWNPQALRIIVPVSDEGPCEGSPCDDPGADRDSIENAIDTAVGNGAVAFAITGAGSNGCVMTLADELGQRTGGRAWHVQSGMTWAEIGAELADEIASLSDARCAICDGDGDGIPNACECPWDIDCDGAISVTDFLDLLAAWGPCPPQADCPADLDRGGDVGITDFLALLAHWGPCPG
jgi:hypothetical protein